MIETVIKSLFSIAKLWSFRYLLYLTYSCLCGSLLPTHLIMQFQIFTMRVQQNSLRLSQSGPFANARPFVNPFNVY